MGDSNELVSLKQLIISRTQGNPFFIEEIVQSLFDEGALIHNGTIRVTRPVSELRIPPTAQAVLASRIDRLAVKDKELLQTLAVIGRTFAVTLVRQMMRRSDRELESILMRLQASEFIYEQPRMGGVEYVFKHALTQDVAYNSLLNETRRMLHERTARAIERLHAHGLEQHYADLAHHYLHGMDSEKAVHYARLAAEQAVSRAAYAEASKLIAAALKLLSSLPNEPKRIRGELALRAVEAAVAYVVNGASSSEREIAIRRMCKLGETLGGGIPLLRGQIALSSVLFNRGEAAQGLELAQRCVELAQAMGELELLAAARYSAGLLALSCGNLRQAFSHLEDGIHLIDHTRHSLSPAGFLYSISFTCNLALILQLLGRVTDAPRIADDGLRQARDSGHIPSLGLALTLCQWLHRYRCEARIVRMHAEEAIALSQENGFQDWLYVGRFHHGWALAQLGQLEQGIAEMEAGVAGLSGTGGIPGQQYQIALLAQAYAKMGRTDNALKMLSRVIAQVERTGEKIHKAEMIRLEGEVLLMHDTEATNEAERRFRTALALAREQEARWWELRIVNSLAELLRKTDSQHEAGSMLREIFSLFPESVDLPDVKEARMMLVSLSPQLV
jgi:tetratricopeptide (TPR) repeat protein